MTDQKAAACFPLQRKEKIDAACRPDPDADYAEEYEEGFALPGDDNYTDYGTNDMSDPRNTE